MPKTRGLTPKQQRFVEEYLVDLNATQAAIRAGYSAKRAHVMGSVLLANRKVAETVHVLRQEQSRRTAITADWVLTRLREEATPGSEDTSFSPSRVKALELLGKHLALFTDRIQAEQRHIIVLDDASLPD